MEINIRKASYEDLPFIHNLVLELANFENAGDQVTASIEDYQNDFKEELFECLVATEGGIILGMALLSRSSSFRAV